jgi:peptidoglycan/LPS O-acetylase OafA/YrhL
MINKGTGNIRLRELDALRGLAVLLVVVFHCTLVNEAYNFKYGAAGVELFFMISGFVIFMSISNISSGRQFVVNRFARLYPIYWVCVSLTFLLHLINEPLTQQLLVRYGVNLTMVQRYLGVDDLDGPYWSLAVELAFYVVIFGIYKLKMLKHTELILLAMVLVELGITIAERMAPGYDGITRVSPTERYTGLFHFLPLFLAGIVFYRVYTGGGSIYRYALIVFCYVAQLSEYPNRHVDMVDLRIGSYAIVVGIFFLLFVLFVNNLLGFIVNKVTVFMGRISYALYLFHQYLMMFVLMPFLTGRLHLSFWLSCVISIAAAVAIAAVNTLLVDEPLRNKLKRALSSRKQV